MEGAMTDQVQTFVTLAVLAGIAYLFFATGLGSAVCNAWRMIAMIGKAIVFVPWGLFLLTIAAAIALSSGGDWFMLLIAGWIAWHGGNYLFGSLAGFTGGGGGQPGGASLANRSALQRRGLFGRR
jgi:hypothetical protein